ncbi:hypothetical protein [Streptosporangium carneum]|uniref:DUF4352 domain-containing protein n=1 Tax=Streptosporangium carneum TaxID=47481 RepID=A0A9W6I3A9_9ACTN|nr:hypothetical protein [Streptosporangium carneum]GLK10403.1 hypothetical protein GCM10017600_38090 [Streptosporangium carneum]
MSSVTSDAVNTASDAVAPAGPASSTRRRRRAPRQPGRARRAGVLAVGAALAVGAVLLQSAALSSEASSAHLTWTGSVGEEVSASRFSAEVKAIHVAKAVEFTPLSGKPKKAETSGVFLVAEVAATATRTPQKLAPPVLLGQDGKRYTATDKVDSSLTITNPYIQVGWWAQSVAVFEIPASALAGSRIVLAPQSGFIAEALLPEVEVDLGLDEASAQRLVANAKDVYPLASKK